MIFNIDFFFNYFIIFMFLMGLFVFCSMHKHLLLTLLSLEFMILVLFMFLFYFLVFFGYEIYFTLIFLTFSVCEGVMGLSILVLLIRSHGNDMIMSISSLF
uniref:NADH-ubiquinone oxidoreductase chain 4L n=1 Tax=Paraplea frontalis TaxID=575836 RepID=A0A059T9D6_9HEMI|nr:NADH dehydrogenase subunit 4L [Paraplea frontalis]AHL44238.1 NADH dehydrogenase subunit 4L [Paraplea frontalis]